MRKIILKVLILLAYLPAVSGCTAIDELPGHMPGPFEKKVKKSPGISPKLPEHHLVVKTSFIIQTTE